MLGPQQSPLPQNSFHRLVSARDGTMDRKEIDNDIKTTEDVSPDSESQNLREETKDADISSSDLLNRLKANLAELEDIGAEDIPISDEESDVTAKDVAEIGKMPPAVVTPTVAIRYHYIKMSRADNESASAKSPSSPARHQDAAFRLKRPSPIPASVQAFRRKTDFPSADKSEEISEADPDLVKAGIPRSMKPKASLTKPTSS